MFTSLIELNLIIALAIASVCASSSYAQERDRIPAGLRPPRHAGIYVVAHRGVHDTIPENTLAAYRRAIEHECDFVEIDVRTTKDGHLVSIHDSTIDRYTIRGEKGKVSEMTLAELQAIDIGSRIDRITVGVVREFEIEQDTLWYIPSGKVEELRKLSDLAWPMPDPGPEKFLSDLLTMHQPPIVASTAKYFSESFATLCHQKNAIVIVDEKDPTSWRPLLEAGADGIQTDHPQELIEFLKSNRAP